MFQDCHIYHSTIKEHHPLKQTYFYGALELTDDLSIGVVRECVTRGRIVRIDKISNTHISKYNRLTPICIENEEYKLFSQLQNQRITLPPHFDFYPEQIISLLQGKKEKMQTSYNSFRFARII